MAIAAAKHSVGAPQLIPFAQTEAAAALQKELLEAYEQTSRAWVARMHSELTLWSDLAAKLSACRSPSEAVEAVAKCAAQRVQMATEDGQRLLNDGQEMTQRISRAINSELPKAST